MPEKAKKYLITAENHEVFILRRNKTFRGYCEECEAEVEMFTFDTVTTRTNIPTRQLIGLLENKLIHAFETTNGHLLICRNSLEIRQKLKN